MNFKFLLMYICIFVLVNKTFSMYTIKYDKYMKNYYDVPSYHDLCEEYFNNFENEILDIKTLIYKNKLDKIPEYIF